MQDTHYLAAHCQAKNQKHVRSEQQGCSEKPVDCKWIHIKTGATHALLFSIVTILILLKNSIFLTISKHWRMSAICGNTRGLSLAGKSLIFKTLALSKLVYTCTMKTPSKNVLDQLSSIHKHFLEQQET